MMIKPIEAAQIAEVVYDLKNLTAKPKDILEKLI